MANPKRRHSNTRTRLRRSHDALTPRTPAQCPQCHAFIMPHCVCGSCGYYKGKQVLTIKVKSKKEK